MSTRRLNSRFALYSVGSLIALCACTYLVHGYQVRRNAGVLLDRADRAQKEGKLERASDYFRRYLGFEPRNADALERYGLLLADPNVAKSKRDVYRAIQTLQKALARDPKKHGLRRNVVRLSIDQELFSSARRDLEEYLIPAFPGDGELALWLGECHEHSGSYGDARNEYERSIRLAPALLDSYAKQANLLRRHSKEVMRPGERAIDAGKMSEGIMDAMIAANEKSYRAFLMHAEDRKRFAPDSPNTIDIVARDIARAVELQPDAVDVIVASAELAFGRKAIDESREILRRGCQLHPNNRGLYLELARLEANAGDSEAAIAVLREGLKKIPKQPDLLWSLTDLLIATNRADEATANIALLEKTGVPKVDIDCFRARLLMNSQQWSDASAILKSAAPKLAGRATQSSDGFAAQQAQQGDLLLGRCCEQLGDYDRALSSFGRVIARDPRSIPGRLGLAVTLAAIGRTTEAIDQYRQLDRLPGAPPAVRVEIAHLLLLRNLERDPEHRVWEEVEAAIDRADALPPLPVQAVVCRSQMLAAKGKWDEARAHLLNKYPQPSGRPLEAWLALASLDERQNHGPAALAILDEADKVSPGSIELRLARARVHFQTTKSDVGPVVAKLTNDLDQLKSGEQKQLLLGLSMLALQSGDANLAKQLLTRLATAQPNDLRCQIGLFDVAVQLSDWHAMETAIAKLRKIESVDGVENADGVLWRYARASMLIAKGIQGDKSGLAEARSLLAGVSAQRSYWSRVTLCQARLDDLEGNREDAALAGYLRVLNSGDSDSFAFRRAIELLYKSRRYAEAYDLMRRLPNQSLQSPEMQRMEAQLALFSNDTSNALKLAESTVAAGSKDFRDYVWLGRIYLALGKTDQAGSVFERARDLAPNEPDARVAFVQFLAVSGKKDQAVTETFAAKAQMSGTKAPMALANCYEAAGMLDEAKAQYESAVAALPSDVATIRGAASYYFRTGQFEMAESLLRRLSKELKSESPEAARWARDRLAILLSVRGDPDRTKEALGLLEADEATLSAASDVADVQRTRATVLSMQNAPQPRREALKILEGLIERHVSVPQDYFMAAQLHEAMGDWPHARFRYLTFMESAGAETPANLFIVARSLLRHGDVEQARPLVAKFQASAGKPASIQKAELQARLFNAEGKAKEAVALIEKSVAQESSNLQSAAELLAELQAHESAEAMFRRNAERTGLPKDALLLAQYLLGRGRYAEVLDICDRVWVDSPPITVTEIALAALAMAPQDPRLFASVERRLEASIRKMPESAALLAGMAAVRNFQGRYDESEQLYRRALGIDANLDVALNNLAWLMSLRGGNGHEAIELLRRAAQVSGVHAGLRDTRGVAYLSLKQSKATELAIEDLRIATSEAPSAGTYFHLAQAYLAASKRKEAVQAWRNAQRLGVAPEVLHPLERPALEQLAAELK